MCSSPFMEAMPERRRAAEVLGGTLIIASPLFTSRLWNISLWVSTKWLYSGENTIMGAPRAVPRDTASP